MRRLMYSWHLIGGILGMLVAMIWSLPISAQSNTAGSENSQPSSGVLEEVIVTARRREENLQTVPVTVNVLSGANLRDQEVVSILELPELAPGLAAGKVTPTRDLLVFSMRGETQLPGSGGPGVVTYFNEVPTFIPGAGYMFDLANVQVLHGAQGTLFGRNATGGAVLLQPQRPTNDFEGEIDETIGDYSLRRTIGVLNVPVFSDKLLLRIAVDNNTRDGFTRDITSGMYLDNVNYTSFRAGLTFRPVESVDNYLLFNTYDANQNASSEILTAVNPKGIALALFPGLNANLAAQQARGPRVTQLDLGPDPYEIEQNADVTDTLVWNLTDAFTLKNILGYRSYREKVEQSNDGSIYPIIAWTTSPYWMAGTATPPATKQFSEELQLQGHVPGVVDWIVGTYLENDEPYSQFGQDRDVLSEFGFFVTYLFTRHDESRAGFGQATWDLGKVLEGLKFTTGLRYTADTRALVRQEYTSLGACEVGIGPSCSPFAQDGSFHATTYDINLDYQFDPSSMVYLAARRGYKAGGFSAIAAQIFPSAYKPEFATEFEVGLKSDWHFGQTALRTNLDVYTRKITDMQVSAVVEGPGGVSSDVTENAATSRVSGFDGEFTFLPTDNIELSLNYGYTHAAYISYVSILNGVEQNLSGLPFTATPENQVSASARYTFPFVPPKGGHISITANYTYQSNQYSNVEFQPVQAPGSDIPAFGLANMRLDWKGAGGYPLDVGLFVTNLTDRLYQVFSQNLYDSVGVISKIYGEPRMYGAEVRYHFGGH